MSYVSWVSLPPLSLLSPNRSRLPYFRLPAASGSFFLSSLPPYLVSISSPSPPCTRPFSLPSTHLWSTSSSSGFALFRGGVWVSFSSWGFPLPHLSSSRLWLQPLLHCSLLPLASAYFHPSSCLGYRLVFFMSFRQCTFYSSIFSLGSQSLPFVFGAARLYFFVRCGDVVRCLLALFLALLLFPTSIPFVGLCLFLRGFSYAISYPSSSLGFFLLYPLVREVVPLVHAFLGRFSSFISLASHASHHYYSLHCLSFIGSFSITATVTFSALFHYAFPFPLGISLAFLAHPSALSLPQDGTVLLAFAFSLTGCFVSLALLFGSPDFRALLLGFLGHCRLSSTSSTAVHFYPLRCSPMGSFPRLSLLLRLFVYSFAFPGFQVALQWLFFLLISSFEFSASVVPSLVAVTCTWCICTLAISPVPHSLPWLCLLIICGFGFFSSSFTALSSLLCLWPFSLWLLVLCLRSFLIVVAYPPVVPPGWSPSSFSLPVHQVLIPSILLSFGSVCPALVPSSFLLPSYLAAASQVVLSPWLILMQFMTLLPLVMLSISIDCWLLLVNFDSLLFGSSFSIVSSSLSELLLLCRISLVFFPGSLGPSVCPYTWVFPPRVPPRFTLLVVGWSSPMALLLPVSPSSTASACHRRVLLSLFYFPSSFGVTVSLYCPLLLFWCRFSLST